MQSDGAKMRGNLHPLKTRFLLSFFFIRNFAPSLRIFVRQILNICDNTLRPEYDKYYVLLFGRVKYFYEKL